MSPIVTVAPLVLVLGTLVALLWWLRRASGRGPASGRHIQVVESISLGPGQSLHLVKLGDRGLLVASTAQRCDLVCEIENVPEPAPAATPAFVDALRRRMGKT